MLTTIEAVSPDKLQYRNEPACMDAIQGSWTRGKTPKGLGEITRTRYNTAIQISEAASVLTTPSRPLSSEWSKHPMPDAQSTPTRRCSKCGNEFPLTSEFFNKCADCREGFRSECKVCQKAYRRGHYQTNKSSIRQHQKLWYETHRDALLPKNAVYRKDHTEQMAAYRNTWRKKHPDQSKAAVVRWEKANPERIRLKWQRRQARKVALPDTLTSEQWSFALGYWKDSCAYCGSPFTKDSKGKLTADHYIPLSDPNCPGTIATNILPACMSCNTGKRGRNPVVWLTRKLGTFADSRLAEIAAYFKAVGETCKP